MTPSNPQDEAALRRSRTAWAALLLSPSILLWVVSLVAYLVSPIFADHAEATVTVIAQQWLHGRPLYHAVDSPYLYSVLYGPACFLSLCGWLQLIPDPILASKLSGAFWALVSTGAILYASWKRFGWMAGIVALGTVTTSSFVFENHLGSFSTFWNRSDPILIAATALGLVSLTLANRRLASACLVISLVLAVNSKVHGFLYLVPVWAVWWTRHGFRSLSSVLLVGALAAMIPFCLPGISLSGYLTWLRMGARHPLHLGQLTSNLTALLTLLLPLAFLPPAVAKSVPGRRLDENTLLALMLTAAGLLVCLPASKVGAGSTHLLPFAPYVGFLFASSTGGGRFSQDRPWGLVVAAVWLLLSVPSAALKTRFLCGTSRNPQVLEADRDLRSLLGRYDPRQMQMGTGGPESYDNTFASPRLYQYGAPRVADGAACMDFKISGLSLDPLTASLRKREFKWWLIPHGDRPFSVLGWYDLKPLYGPDSRQALLDHYTIVESTGSWDVYQAKAAAP